MIGDGLRLLEDLGPDDLQVEQREASSTPLVTHVHYRVVRPAPGATA